MQASRLGKMSAFRRQFRECSALLLDDLHFLATKKATQEEFLHTFDALVADGRQVVVTTDCHPRLADELMPELVDRLLGGAVWGLLPPDPETRLEILRKKATGGAPGDPRRRAEVRSRRSLRGNVRELEGAVNSVRHYAKVTGRPVDQAAGARGARRPAAARGPGGDGGGRGRGGVRGAAAAGRARCSRRPGRGR